MEESNVPFRECSLDIASVADSIGTVATSQNPEILLNNASRIIGHFSMQIV